MNAAEPFTLVPGRWYAWHQFPGYSDYPHITAVLLRTVRPLRSVRDRLNVEYHDAGYATGVQEFQKTVRILHRSQTSVVLAFEKDDERKRVATVTDINDEWLRKFQPAIAEQARKVEGVQELLWRVTRAGTTVRLP